jgi:hypothetical protein
VPTAPIVQQSLWGSEGKALRPSGEGGHSSERGRQRKAVDRVRRAFPGSFTVPNPSGKGPLPQRPAAALDSSAHISGNPRSGDHYGRGRASRLKPKHFGGRQARQAYLLRARGAYVSCSEKLHRARTGTGRWTLHSRGRVSKWSKSSKRRCARELGSLVVRDDEVLVFGVVTIPDKATGLGHFRRLLTDNCRRWGMRGGVWNREYQHRGAVHFNVWGIVRSSDVALFQSRWFAYVRRAGTRWGDYTYCEVWHGGLHNALAYAVNYATAKKNKAYQHILPAGVEGAGRWWGGFGDRGEWVVREVSYRQYCYLCQAKRDFREDMGWAPGFEFPQYVVWANAPPGVLELLAL